LHIEFTRTVAKPVDDKIRHISFGVSVVGKGVKPAIEFFKRLKIDDYGELFLVFC
jgi:hypothetical protein